MSVIESMRRCHRSRCQTQPVYARKSLPQLQNPSRFKRRRPSIAVVLPLQLLHEVPELGRQLGIFRAKVLLQPFADGAANRSAGDPIDRFAALADSVGHRGFRSGLLLLIDMGPSHRRGNCFLR
jgi:hypothetical protein